MENKITINNKKEEYEVEFVGFDLEETDRKFQFDSIDHLADSLKGFKSTFLLDYGNLSETEKRYINTKIAIERL